MNTTNPDPKASLLARWEHDVALHRPENEDVGRLMEVVRSEYRRLGAEVINMLPPGRDLSMALTDLETSLRCAIAAIAKNQDQIG